MKKQYSRNSFAVIVKKYKKERRLTVRKFAAQLSEAFKGTPVSYETISRWSRLKDPAPDIYFLLNCVVSYSDWRRDFALEAIKVILPHVFGEQGVFTFKLPKAQSE